MRAVHVTHPLVPIPNVLATFEVPMEDVDLNFPSRYNPSV